MTLRITTIISFILFLICLYGIFVSNWSGYYILAAVNLITFIFDIATLNRNKKK